MNRRSAQLEEHIATLDVDEKGIARHFYVRLFEKHPGVKPLFSGNEPEAQQKMLNEALALVVLHSDDLSAIAGELRGLGEQHRDYGDITPEMYDAVVACLVQTLHELAPSAWSPALEETWTALLGEVAAFMQEGHY